MGKNEQAEPVEMALMNFRLKPEFHRDFKIAAAMNDKHMSVFLSELTQDFIDSGSVASDDNEENISGTVQSYKICQFRIPATVRDDIRYISTRDGVSMTKTFEAIWNRYQRKSQS